MNWNMSEQIYNGESNNELIMTLEGMHHAWNEEWPDETRNFDIYVHKHAFGGSFECVM